MIAFGFVMIRIVMIMVRFVMIVIMRFGMVMKENWSSFVVIMIMETIHRDHHICRWCWWRRRRRQTRRSRGHYRGDVIVIIDVVHIVILIVTQHIAHFIHRNHLQS